MVPDLDIVFDSPDPDLTPGCIEAGTLAGRLDNTLLVSGILSRPVLFWHGQKFYKQQLTARSVHSQLCRR